jgi:hypothetical protein
MTDMMKVLILAAVSMRAAKLPYIAQATKKALPPPMGRALSPNSVRLAMMGMVCLASSRRSDHPLPPTWP